jgi:hypothetical protein
MNLKNLLRWLRLVTAGTIAAALAAGCASLGASSRPAEQIVLERAQARWNALVERDFAAAYAFLTSGYRAVVPLQTYRRQSTGPAQWEGAKAQSAKCEAARCIVSVEITFRLGLPGHADRVQTTYVDETWVLEDGQWFKYEAL